MTELSQEPAVAHVVDRQGRGLAYDQIPIVTETDFIAIMASFTDSGARRGHNIIRPIITELFDHDCEYQGETYCSFEENDSYNLDWAKDRGQPWQVGESVLYSPEYTGTELPSLPTLQQMRFV